MRILEQTTKYFKKNLYSIFKKQLHESPYLSAFLQYTQIFYMCHVQ